VCRAVWSRGKFGRTPRRDCLAGHGLCETLQAQAAKRVPDSFIEITVPDHAGAAENTQEGADISTPDKQSHLVVSK
jgi:hypothetical protein